MNISVPEQCSHCKYLFYDDETALCRKRQVQSCVRENDIQKLIMVPGQCMLINPNNDCKDFKAPLFLCKKFPPKTC
ncbi:MAG: hypothetical protein GX117_06155 [Candidatus Hydrogenedentes bacterium]|nr:hypothetical protein [Candidatus Hydrogenedentota bacterium]